MSNAKIRFAPDILQRLGEELNPSPDQGILELVKNSYDADAVNCTIELKDTDNPGGSILIRDDGDGMDIDDILNGWLVLGKSEKSVKNRTRLGRIPAGNKGLGRLAALRMGTGVVLTTRPRVDETKQFSLYIDWADYENVNTVDEVDLLIEVQKRPANFTDGTEVLIEGLRTTINKTDVKKLSRALLLLADPFGDNPEGFNPHLIASEFAEFEELVKRRYFDDARYYLVAEVDSDGYARATVNDWKGEELFSADHSELARYRENQTYCCPPARFDLWVYILNSASFAASSVTLSEVRSWLREFGGVHLYENGLRVNPYGNPGNDWLDMNLRRVQSPEERPGTNSSIGRISIANTEGLLIQKTDRSGFIESEQFFELKSFAKDALDWMARRRLEIAEKRRARERSEAPKQSNKSQKTVEEVIKDAPKESQTNLNRAFQSYVKTRDREVKRLQEEIQLYRTLSTAGITAATFAHESSGNPIKVITKSVNTIQRRAKEVLNSQYHKLLEKPVSRIIKSTEALSVLGTATLRLIEHEKRKIGRVELHKVINDVLSTFEPFFEGRDVKVIAQLCSGNPYLQGSEAAVESIITNLLNNGLAAFEYQETLKSREIYIRTSIEDDMVVLQVLDNGPGIKGLSIKDIWLPGQTTRLHGTGLGLTIVRDAVVDLNGEYEAIAKNEEFGGAEFIIRLPILGV